MKYTKDVLEDFFYPNSRIKDLICLLNDWSEIPEEDRKGAINGLYKAALRAMQQYADTWPVKVFEDYGIVRCCYYHESFDKKGGKISSFLFYYPDGSIYMKNNFVWGQDSEVQLFSLKAWVPAKKYRDKLKKLREGMKTMLELRHEKEIRQIKRKRSCSRDPDALNMSVLKSISIIAYWQIKQYQGKTKELKAPQGKSLQERWQLFTRVEAERRKIFDMKDRYPDDEDWSYACDIHGISRSIHDKNQEILADWWRQMKTGNPLAGYTVQRNWEFCIHPGKEDRFLQAFQKFKIRKEDSGWTSGSQSETLIEILGSTEYSRHCAAMRHGERYSELLTACADCVNLISGDIFRQILETDSLKPGMTFEDRSNKDIHLTVSPGFYQLMKDMNILASESLKESEAAAE